MEILAEQEITEVKTQRDGGIKQGIDIEVVPRSYLSKSQIFKGNEILDEILLLLKVRPCTIQDISNMTGKNLSEIGKYMEGLLDAKKVLKRFSNDEAYYQIKEERLYEN